MFDEIIDLLNEGNDQKQPYLFTGKVTENKSDEHPCCVRVEIPEHTKDMNKTAWARVITPFAGNKFGMYSLPDIGDEVALIFRHGEANFPIIIGSLFNAEAPAPEEAVSDENTVKCIKTKAGHILIFDDTKDAKKIELISSSKISVKIDDEKKTIIISTSSKNEVKIDEENGKIDINADKNIKVKTGSCEITLDGGKNSTEIKASNVKIKADQSLTLESAKIELKGTNISLKADAKVEIKGANTSVKADAQLDLNSSGMTNVKGSMLKLN